MQKIVNNLPSSFLHSNKTFVLHKWNSRVGQTKSIEFDYKKLFLYLAMEFDLLYL